MDISLVLMSVGSPVYVVFWSAWRSDDSSVVLFRFRAIIVVNFDIFRWNVIIPHLARRVRFVPNRRSQS